MGDVVYGYFAAWQKVGVFHQLNGLLRRLVREAEGRSAESSVCVLDAQSVKTSANVPPADQALTQARKAQVASATSASTPLACCWRSG